MKRYYPLLVPGGLYKFCQLQNRRDGEPTFRLEKGVARFVKIDHYKDAVKNKYNTFCVFEIVHSNYSSGSSSTCMIPWEQLDDFLES